MRFLCDEMLVRLARLLRAAGYDAAMATAGTPDDKLLRIAHDEQRLLLTRDKRLSAQPGAMLVGGSSAVDEARQLSKSLSLDWSLAPFTRCVIDNTVLREATTKEIASMPASAQAKDAPFRACPVCRRLYWPGSHVKRMKDRLAGLG